MHTLPIRLQPGSDLRASLEALVRDQAHGAGFVVSGIGSLHGAVLRYADQASAATLDGPMEIVSISGSISADGAHLHMAVSDGAGRVWGGHVGYGNIVRTTVEALIVTLPEWSLSREHDLRTGYPELVVRRREPPSK